MPPVNTVTVIHRIAVEKFVDPNSSVRVS